MIYLLHGENLFLRDEWVAKLTGGQSIERYARHEVDESRLVDVFSGTSLFASQRVVLIDELSSEKTIWSVLPDWLERADSDSTLIFVEPKADKRTKTYKAFQKYGKVIDCSPWGIKQTRQAEAWLAEYAAKRDLSLTNAQVSQLVARAVRLGLDDQPMIDQALLASVVAQLSHAPKLDNEIIDTVMADETHDNVFGLLEAALSGDPDRLATMIARLRPTQDGHRVMALLNSQAVQLVGLVLAREEGISSLDTVASDLGAHPYALRQLSGVARQLGTGDIARLIERLAWADERLKRGAKPWTMIEAALGSLTPNK